MVIAAYLKDAVVEFGASFVFGLGSLHLVISSDPVPIGRVTALPFFSWAMRPVISHSQSTAAKGKASCPSTFPSFLQLTVVGWAIPLFLLRSILLCLQDCNFVRQLLELLLMNGYCGLRVCKCFFSAVPDCRQQDLGPTQDTIRALFGRTDAVPLTDTDGDFRNGRWGGYSAPMQCW
jgi:hypothetical protein